MIYLPLLFQYAFLENIFSALQITCKFILALLNHQVTSLTRARYCVRLLV